MESWPDLHQIAPSVGVGSCCGSEVHRLWCLQTFAKATKAASILTRSLGGRRDAILLVILPHYWLSAIHQYQGPAPLFYVSVSPLLSSSLAAWLNIFCFMEEEGGESSRSGGESQIARGQFEGRSIWTVSSLSPSMKRVAASGPALVRGYRWLLRYNFRALKSA